MTRMSVALRWIGLTAAPFLAILALSGPANAHGSGCVPADLKAKLNQIESQFGPVQVISTFRRGARIAGSGRMSYHASCRAVDFNPPPGKYQAVVNWLKANHSGGVGTYSCGMNHIHIDNGAKVRFHKCQGGGRYVSKSRGSKRYAYKSGGSKRYASKKSGGRYASKARSGKRYASGKRGYRYASYKSRSGKYSSYRGGKKRYSYGGGRRHG